MRDKPVALVTGATKESGVKSRRTSRPHGFTVLVGLRNLEHGERAAKSVGADARVLQLDDTNQGSIAAAAERIPERTRPSRRAREERGVSHGEKPGSSLEEVVKSSRLSGVSRRGARGKPVHRPCVLSSRTRIHRREGELERSAAARYLKNLRTLNSYS
jgi:hypothetical protein